MSIDVQNKKRVLFLNAYYLPEKIAFTHLENDLIDELIRNNYSIDVVTPIPTRGVTHDTRKRFSKIKLEKVKDGNLSITRFWSPKERKNPLLRFLRYLWCHFMEYRICRKYTDIDLIFAVSTPPTQGFLASIILKKLNKRNRKTKFIYNLQDMFPESLVNTKITQSNSLLYRFGNKIACYTYQNADKIIVISDAFKKSLLQKDVDDYKIDVVSNWVDVKQIKQVPKEKNKLFEEFGIDREKFIIVYAGNIGESQGAEIILEVAEILKAETNIRFVIFGGGTGYDDFKNKVISQNFNNIFIYPLLDKERVSEVYSIGDIALITGKSGVGMSGVPSKTWNIMSCKTPIIASFDKKSELASAISDANAGQCIDPENPVLLADTIIAFKNTRNYKDYYGNNYLEKYCSKDANLAKIVNIFNNIE
ncbi:MAG: glycosyltransferase family 4 protein [Bacillota bacterium]